MCQLGVFSVLHIENPKDSTKKLLKRINIFSKVAGCTINNNKKTFVFLYTTTTIKHLKKKERKPFTY